MALGGTSPAGTGVTSTLLPGVVLGGTEVHQNEHRSRPS